MCTVEGDKSREGVGHRLGRWWEEGGRWADLCEEDSRQTEPLQKLWGAAWSVWRSTRRRWLQCARQLWLVPGCVPRQGILHLLWMQLQQNLPTESTSAMERRQDWEKECCALEQPLSLPGCVTMTRSHSLSVTELKWTLEWFSDSSPIK